MDDGSWPTSLFGEEIEFVFDIQSATQNLFFLHGAFHIYKDGKKIKKITQQTDKALYHRLEDIVNSEDHDIVCVFQEDNKKEAIEQNNYLKKCFDKLKLLSGQMVIIGCSLSENDNHIFKQINDSNITTLYVSTLAELKEEMYKRALVKFPKKSVLLFDAESITYELPDN